MSENNLNTDFKASLTLTLLQWYEEHKRDLPWRKTFLPYHIWISEMMLQQTQMTRGVLYFERWIERFPSIAHVAEASLEELYKYWEGLGYYSRVRNIHITAKRIIEEYDGNIPEDLFLLENLQGIGPYTARAIASIAYNQDVPVVDANVIRIITRIFGIKEVVSSQRTKKAIYRIVESLLPQGNARTFNQAMMEFGALICSKQTKCCACPFSTSCYAYLNNCVHELPTQAPKKQIHTYMTMALILIQNNTVFMRKRPERGLWANLWEFPEYIFIPRRNKLQKQHTFFSEQQINLNPLDTSTSLSLPSSSDLEKAFYDEYDVHLDIINSHISTKYSFTTNRVTLYAFYALLPQHIHILQSKYHPYQEIAFYSKEQILQQTLSAGQSTIRSTLLNFIR